MLGSFTPTTADALCDASNVSEIIGVTGAFCGAALLAVILRIYVRIAMLKFVGPDDYMMIAAMLMAVGCLICFVGETTYGLGRHQSCISLPDTEMFSKWTFYHSLWLMFGVVFVKISIALFLQRLAPKAAWKRILWGIIVFLICFSLACAGTLIFSCVPVAASWDFALQKQPGTKCFSAKTYGNIGLFNSVINICTDFLFALLPIPIIIGLQVNLRTKLSLAFILSLGFVACAAGIVKAHLQANFLETPDRLWHDSFMVWNMLELCLGILAASLPSLKPLFTSLLANTKTALGLSGSRSKNNPSGGYVPKSQNSGYRRQYDPRNFNEMMADVDLQDYQKQPDGSIESQIEAEPTVDMAAVARAKRPYRVRITSGDLRAQDDTWQSNGHYISRSESEERLHHPGIYKTLEVTRTSEVARR